MKVKKKKLSVRNSRSSIQCVGMSINCWCWGAFLTEQPFSKHALSKINESFLGLLMPYQMHRVSHLRTKFTIKNFVLKCSLEVSIDFLIRFSAVALSGRDCTQRQMP